MGVSATIGLDLGLHERSFRDTLIEEPFTVGVWPLAETRSTRARDITGNRNHGTYTGSGFTAGVSTDLPEGGLGRTFDGNGWVEVPDDGLSSGLNLSLAAGSMDIVFLIKTAHNSATNRCIVQKMTGTTGNGYSVSLESQAIRFRVEVGGSELFNFTRGTIADNAWHLVHCFYDPATQEARIFIDGVQSGATVATGTTEPAYVAEDLRIGAFSDDSGPFIGTLAYVMVGREGNVSLAAELQALRAWTSVVADTRATVPMTIRYGISGTDPRDNVAQTGVLTFGLNNAMTNSGGAQGYYSTAHASCRTGFRKGIPARAKFTYGGSTYIKHVGRVVSIAPTPGQYREQISRVTSVDWIDVAASTPLTNLKAQTNIGYGDLVGLVVDEALRPPHGVEISDGSEDFVYALDIGNGKEERLLSELSRDATSERGYIFIKGDAVYGGVLTVQGRGDRQIDTSLAATFTNTMHGLDAADEHAPNIVRVTVHPREVDPAATTVLFSMTQRQPIPPGETRVIEVDYRDPADPSVQVGGTAMVTPVASTDYTMNVASDGSGADLTSSVTIAETGDDLGGTAARLTVTNTHGTLVGWFLTQLRGKGIYHENPVTIPAENSADVRKNGPSAQDLDLPYGTNADFAYDVARNLLELFETAQVRTLTFIANDSDALMTQALAREPGDRIGIVETMTGATTVIDGSDAERGYFINQIELTVTEGGLIVCKWTLAPSLATGPAWVLGEAGASELDESTVLGL